MTSGCTGDICCLCSCGCWKTCCLACCRKIAIVLERFLALLFSHMGLCGLVAGYAVMGAFLFRAIELPEEMKRKGHMRNDTESIMVELRKYTEDQKVLDKKEWTAKAENLLKEYEKLLVKAVNLEGYDGDDENVKTQWTFSGALLYSFTVITTIGYGHIAPRTTLGKMVTILYATIGIPLMLMCLANIAETMAQIFTFIYFKICCAYCRFQKKRREMMRKQLMITYKNVNALRRGGSLRSVPGQRGYPPSTVRRHPSFKSTGSSSKKSLASPHVNSRVPSYNRGKESKADNRLLGKPGRRIDRSASDKYLRNVTPTLRRANKPVPPKRGIAAGLAATMATTVVANMTTVATEATSTLSHFGQFSNALRHQLSKAGDLIYEGATRAQAKASSVMPVQARQRCNCCAPIVIIESPMSPSDSFNPPLSNPVTLAESATSVTLGSADSTHLAAATSQEPDSTLSMQESSTFIFDDQKDSCKESRFSSTSPLHECYVYRSPLTAMSVTERGYYAPPSYLPRNRSAELIKTGFSYADEEDNSRYIPMDTMVVLAESSAEQGGTVTIPSRRSTDDWSFRSASAPALRKATMAVPKSTVSTYEPEPMPERMPVSAGFIIVIGFIATGAILFSVWETWNIFDGAYFCFITLTTIGFGDIVPATSMEQDIQESLIICSIYLLIGMALIAMCFKLMQDDVVQKTRWLGEKIGLLASTKPIWYEEDDEDEEFDEEEESEQENASVKSDEKRTVTSSGSLHAPDEKSLEKG